MMTSAPGGRLRRPDSLLILSADLCTSAEALVSPVAAVLSARL